MENTLLPFVSEFWAGLGIITTNISVDIVGDDINIRIETPDSALLIGMHGKNIEAFQHLLNRMIERQSDRFIHIHLEVNDYMKQKDEKLFRFLDSKIVLVTSTGKSIHMPSLTPYERKKAHSYIADKNMTGLKTQSEGEGAERVLVLSYTGDTIVRPATSHTIENSKTNTTTQPLLSDEGIGI